MALTSVEKMRVLGYIKNHGYGKLFYGDMAQSINRKGKVNEIEFLDFFVEYFIKNLNTNVVSQNFLFKVVACIEYLVWSIVEEYGKSLSEDRVKLLRSFKGLYEDFLCRMKEEGKEEEILEFTEAILRLDASVNQYFPPMDERCLESSQEILEYEDREALKAEIEAAKKELAVLMRECKKLERKVHSQSILLDERKKQIRDLTKENSRYENKLNGLLVDRDKVLEEEQKLREQIRKLEEEIFKLKQSLESVSNDKRELRDSLQIMQTENERLEGIVLDYQRKESKRFLDIQTSGSVFTFDENMKNIILTIVSKRKSTIGDILRGLNNRGYHLTRAEIKEYLKEIRRTVQIHVEEDYQEFEIERPSVLTNRTFSVPLIPGTRCIDLLAVSDFHISDMDSKTMRDLDILNEYCAKEGIGIILNGGDFFSFKSYSKNKRHMGMASWQQLVEKVILHYPYDENLIHLVLGGNHDRDSLTGGIDAIKTLACERMDFAYLGYGSAKIAFNGSVSMLNSIGIHHPNRRYMDFVGEYAYATEDLQATINSLFTRNGENRDTYLDLVGHIHKSSLDMDAGICVLPSYMKDRVMNGAWHLKVYFDGEGNVCNIVLFPLIKGERLEKVTEINYVKKKVLGK